MYLLRPEGTWTPYEVPSDWRCVLYSLSPNLRVNCADCGDQVRYETTHFSRFIVSDLGMGYAVCADCSKGEWAYFS